MKTSQYLQRLRVVLHFQKLTKSRRRLDLDDLKEAGAILGQAAMLLTLPAWFPFLWLYKTSAPLRIAARSEPTTEQLTDAIRIIEERRAREKAT